jgi:predicted naringenin-chalcone synthase
MSFISHIGTAVPKNKHLQSEILKFMLAKTNFSPTEQRMVKLMYGMSGIESRYSVLDVFSHSEQEGFFETETKVQDRLSIYDREAVMLAQAAIKDAEIELSKVTHLITISCTGLSAPGLDIALVKALDLDPEIERTSVNFMGCYAAIHGLKMADAIAKSRADASVLVVSVELCTLHFQAENKLDFITSNLLFGDGAACVLVNSKGTGLRIDSFYSKLFLEAENSMAWNISENGFLMKLATDVPDIVFQNINGFIATALAKLKSVDRDNFEWLIHPGGRKILEASAKALGLKTEALAASFGVLKAYGNMSSATLLFILKAVFHSPKKHLLLTGFGPGITMESVILSRA